MAPLAILFGVLQIALGVTLYLLASVDDQGKRPITALIPAFFGLGLLVCGLLARNEKLRMHVMHLAALLGLVGVAIPLQRLVTAMMNGAEWKLPHTGQAIMVGLSGVFLVLCIRSFIQARRARKQREAGA